MIPLLDLKPLNMLMQKHIDDALLRVAHSGRYILDREVSAFEEEWAEYCGSKFCIGTGNCLDAINLMLQCSGLSKGCEVIVPANTYIATWLGVTLAGMVPVPVEPDPATYNMDPKAVGAAITPRTEAILATHLYGYPADVATLWEVAERHGLALFADAAQAHGTTVDGKKVGNLCDAEAFSFYPTKNLGALGDAGCITTHDNQLAEKARRMRNYGGVGRVDHTVKGINSRMDEMQAAVLRAKLPYLDKMNAARRKRASIYDFTLSSKVIPPNGYNGLIKSNYHLYVIRVQQREYVIRRLAAAGIDAHVHYPVPPHLEDAYKDLFFKAGQFPIAEMLANEVLSLPIGNDVDVAQIAQKVGGALCGLM